MNRLLPAFASPTGMPYMFVNLKTGAVRGEGSFLGQETLALSSRWLTCLRAKSWGRDVSAGRTARAPSASDSGNMQEGRIASSLQGALGRRELQIAAPPRPQLTCLRRRGQMRPKSMGDAMWDSGFAKEITWPLAMLHSSAGPD